MCGIVSYIGNKDAYPIIIKGLKRLEYRGYDSAGVALLSENKDLKIFKKQGRVANSKNLFSEAESYLLKALDCGFTNKNLLMQLGISYGGQKKFLQSLIAFQNALKYSLAFFSTKAVG